MFKLKIATFMMLILGLIIIPALASAQSSFNVNLGADLYNRYVWRGMDIANTPSLQPSLSAGYYGFELGTWGAYTLSNEASDSDEIDFWLSYTRAIGTSLTATLIATDYYFPNGGIKIGNFNNYDDPDGPGAHTIEIGLSITGPENFPITGSGYINVHNEEGGNIYFQIDYPVTIGEYTLNFTVGGTPGSEDNPYYYGTDNLQIINIGVSSSKDIKVSDDFILPATAAFILNPREEIAYLLFGLSF
jgi:hypothetical protein